MGWKQEPSYFMFLSAPSLRRWILRSCDGFSTGQQLSNAGAWLPAVWSIPPPRCPSSARPPIAGPRPSSNPSWFLILVLFWCHPTNLFLSSYSIPHRIGGFVYNRKMAPPPPPGSISNSPCSILPKPYLYRAGIDMVFCRFCCFQQNFKQEIHIIHAYMPYQSVQKFLKQILQKTISTPERYRYGFSHFFSFNYSSWNEK